jgi:hypothetical protein
MEGEEFSVTWYMLCPAHNSLLLLTRECHGCRGAAGRQGRKRSTSRVWVAPANVGEHNAGIYMDELGLARGELVRLHEGGII